MRKPFKLALFLSPCHALVVALSAVLVVGAGAHAVTSGRIGLARGHRAQQRAPGHPAQRRQELHQHQLVGLRHHGNHLHGRQSLAGFSRPAPAPARLPTPRSGSASTATAPTASSRPAATSTAAVAAPSTTPGTRCTRRIRSTTPTPCTRRPLHRRGQRERQQAPSRDHQRHHAGLEPSPPPRPRDSAKKAPPSGSPRRRRAAAASCRWPTSAPSTSPTAPPMASPSAAIPTPTRSSCRPPAGTVKAQPTGLGSGGQSFSVTWHHS